MKNFLPTLKRITGKCSAHFSVFHSPVMTRLFFVLTIIILSAFDSLGQTTCLASASSNSPVCTGSTLNLYENGGYATSWLWTGPNGFTSTLQNPSIPNASEINSGVYTVVISNGECTSSASVIVSSDPIVVTDCPDDIVACADTFENDEYGAYIDWQIPQFELNCMGLPGSSHNFVMGFELPEVKWACWTFNRVQRIGPSVVNLWQSTGTGDPYILTPSVYIEPPLDIEMDIVCEPGRSFTWSVYLVSGLTESFAGSVFVNATGHYTVNIPSTFTDDIYRLKFVFSGNGNNKCAVDNIYFEALLMDLGDCVGGIEFNVTGPIPGFFACGDSSIVYTATYTSPSLTTVTQTCEFNVKVECVTALVSSISNVSCASNNGEITVSAQSSSDVTPELEYSVNGGAWTSFGAGSSLVTIGNLAPGTYSINVRDVSLSGDCEIYEPLIATVGGIIDTIPPTITCPSNSTLEGCSTSAITGLAYSESIATITALQFTTAGGTASDNCGIVYYAYQDSKNGVCPIIVTRTFTVRDLQGNSISCTQTIQIIHSAAPVVPANGESTVACLSAAITPVPPVVLDACGRNVNPVLTSTVDVPALISCEGTRTYTYTYTDCAGLSSVWRYIYTIERLDFIPAANQSSTIACAALAVTPVLPVVNDNCGNPITPTGPVMSGTYTNCEGTIIYTYNYADCEGNNHNWTYTYTIERLDFVPPSPTSATVACYSAIVLPIPPVVTDNCGTILLPTGPVEGTVPGCEGTVTYTWTYTDCEGNTHDYVHTVTIERQDFTPAGNQSSTVACAALAVTPVLPVVNDNCGNPITPTGPVMSGTYTNCEGTIIYTYNYADCEGNNHNWTYTYTIERLDFVPPSPTSSTVACYSAIVLPTPPVVRDNCGTILLPTGPVEGTVPGCEGTVTYTWTYTDCEGNTHDYVHTVTIERQDFTPAGNQSSTVACAALAVTPVLPVVNDNCGNPITPTGPVMSGTYTNCEGTIIYTYNYADCEGNNHDWVYTYTIERLDFVPPSPTSATVACYSAIVLPTPPVVRDNCGTILLPTGPVEGTVPGCEGTVTYTWTFTDCEGNTHNYVHTVTIERQDFTPAANQASTIACAALAVTPVLPVVNDNCGNPITPTGPVMSGTYAGCEGTIIYTYNYADCEGNNHNWTYTYTIERLDFVPPSPTSATVACYSAIVLPTPPIVRDNCGTILLPIGPVEGTVPGCEGTVTYTWTYTDCEGNTHNYVHTVTIERQDFTPAANQSSTIACAALAVTPVLPVVNDNCGNPITPTGPVMSGTYAGCEGTIIYTYNYADCEGNNHNWSYTYTIEHEDFIPPQPTSATVPCISAIIIPVPPVVMDNCGTVLVPAGPVRGKVPGCEGEITYTWTYTDCEGNTHDYVHTVTIEIEDFIPPANQSSTIACPGFAVTPSLPVVHDNCGALITPTGPVMSGTYVDCEGTIIYTYNYADCEGNNHDWSYTYTVERNTFIQPLPTTATVPCYASIVLPDPPVVMDNCGTVLAPTGPVEGTVPGCEGTVTYTWIYTDCEGNTHDYVHTVNIEYDDFIPPVNQSSTVACAALAVAPVLPIVSDKCGKPIVPTGPVMSGTYTNCEGTIIYTYNYADCEGNNHDWVYTYTIERLDFVPPSPTSATVACYSAIVLPTPPVVADNCGAILVPTGPVEGSVPGCEGIVTYTWTYTDCEGNSHEYVHSITIERQDFIPASDQESTVHCASQAILPALPIVTDNCGIPIVPTGPVMSGTYNNCEGTIIYTYNYADCEGNNHNWNYTYYIDDEDLVIPANDGSTVSCISNAIVPLPPLVNDICGNAIIPSSPLPGGTYNGCEGTRTYTFYYVACDGDTSDWVYTYTIEREPFIKPPDVGSVISCAVMAVPPELPVVTDNCGNILTPGAPVISSTPECEGTITYTYLYVDCEGNIRNWVYTYTIEHEDFLMPPDDGSTVNCIQAATEPIPPAVFDNCNNPILPSLAVTGGTYNGCEGTRTYTFTFTDCEGNQHDWVYTYTIERVPFTNPPDEGSTVECAAQAVPPLLPMVTDNCGNVLTPGAPVISEAPACEGFITYTYLYADCEGNTQDWVYTYVIDDITPPTGTAPANITGVQCIADVPVADIAVITDESDNCGGNVTVTVNDVNNGGSGCVASPYIITRTYTLTDCSGLSTDLVQLITVADTTPPVIHCPSNIQMYNDAGICGAIVSVPQPTYSDGCGIVTIINSYNQSSDASGYYPVGTTNVTWTAIDACGNTTSCTMSVTVIDNEPPAIVCPADINSCTLNINLGVPDVSDNCQVQSITNNAPVTFPVGIATDVIWTVTDIYGNSATCVQSVTASDMTASATASSQVSCFNDSDGIITVTAAGGTGAYLYSLNYQPAQTSNVFSGLPAGTYVVWVSDENGCEVMVQPWIIIDNPPELTVTASGSAQVSCYNFNDGEITATASGGTGDYSYSLNGGPLQSSNIFTDLPSGNYVVTVYDEMGCEASSNAIVINNPVLLEVTGVISRLISCYHGSDGEITAIASGGTEPYLYSINHSISQSSNVFSGLTAGTYVISIVDKNGCAANSQEVILTDPPQLEAYIETTGQVSCANGADATVTVIATGGIGTLSYRLDQGLSQVSNVFTGLIPGNYTITIYDENLCSITLDVAINNPDTLASDVKTKEADCSGKHGGMIELSTSGGTGNYSYIWSNGATTAVVTGLGAQTYFVTITDENGCTEVRSCAVNSEARTELEINNAFSPNGDGINDLWVIKNLYLYPENEVILLNRWGDEVFTQKNYQSDWNGSDLLEGTYFYIINVRQCDEDVVYKGYLTILR